MRLLQQDYSNEITLANLTNEIMQIEFRWISFQWLNLCRLRLLE